MWDGDADETIDWWIRDLPPVTDPVAPVGTAKTEWRIEHDYRTHLTIDFDGTFPTDGYDHHGHKDVGQWMS
jgi:hypothetical protein